MKNNFLALFLVMFIHAQSTAQFRDDFSDGNFNSAPVWTGDTLDFEINSQHQLQLNASGSDTSVLMTCINSLSETEWRFWVKMSFNTSLNNYACIYLASDSPDIGNQKNAFYLRLGGADDSLVFYRWDGMRHIPLFCFPGLATNKTVNTLRLKIIRDKSGNWDFWADSTGGTAFVNYGHALDQESFTVTNFGIFCRYTSSNSRKFYFDDFYTGDIQKDESPPVVNSAGFSDSNTIRITFSEPLDKGSVSGNDNFRFRNHPGIIENVFNSPEGPGIILIRINNEETGFFCDSLRITKVKDLSGNIIRDTTLGLCYYIPAFCESGDVIFNEILFDPDVPGTRFVEFMNRSVKVIRLEDLAFSLVYQDREASDKLPVCDSPRMLSPGEYYVVTVDSETLVKRYHVPFPGKISALKIFPALDSDSGRLRLIRRNDSSVIDEFRYSKEMHFPYLSQTAGVSLERISPEVPALFSPNWQSASESSGYATPGYINSHHFITGENGIDVLLSNRIISPDNDGRDDFLEIVINTKNKGQVASIRIFDIQARMVRMITGGCFISDHSVFIWDGTDDSHEVVPTGYYLILAESDDSGGHRFVAKKTVAVTGRFRD